MLQTTLYKAIESPSLHPFLAPSIRSVCPSVCPYSICGVCRSDCLLGLSDCGERARERPSLERHDFIWQTKTVRARPMPPPLFCTDKKHRVMSNPFPSSNARTERLEIDIIIGWKADRTKTNQITVTRRIFCESKKPKT